MCKHFENAGPSYFDYHDCDEPVSQVPRLLCLTPVDGSNELMAVMKHNEADFL